METLLRPGLAVIMAAVAAKLLLADVYMAPAWASPAFIAAVLAVVAGASIRHSRSHRNDPHTERQCPPGDASRPPASRGEAAPLTLR